MKKCIILFLCCISLPSCALFELPAMLFSQLIPLAIQYAPYALMFIEETEERSIASNDVDTFSQEMKLNIHKPVEEMEDWQLAYQKIADKTSKKVYLINLKNITQERLVELYAEMSSLGKVHYHFVRKDEENKQHDVATSNVLVYNTNFDKFE